MKISTYKHEKPISMKSALEDTTLYETVLISLLQ